MLLFMDGRYGFNNLQVKERQLWSHDTAFGIKDTNISRPINSLLTIKNFINFHDDFSSDSGS